MKKHVGCCVLKFVVLKKPFDMIRAPQQKDAMYRKKMTRINKHFTVKTKSSEE